MPNDRAQPRRERGERQSLREAVFAYVAFAGLSTASRVFLPLFMLVIVAGMTFPLLWGRRTHDPSREQPLFRSRFQPWGELSPHWPWAWALATSSSAHAISWRLGWHMP